MGRVASGVKGISLSGEEEVIGVAIVSDEQNQILAITKLGYGKRTEVDEYRCQNRGGKGVKTINVTEKNGNLAKLISVVGDEDLLVVSDKGIIIRTPINQISILKRATQGVKIINLLEDHQVCTVAIIDSSEDDDEFIETENQLVVNSEPEKTEEKAAETDEIADEPEENTEIDEIIKDSF